METKHRYEVHAIRSEKATSVHPEVLASTDDFNQAYTLAEDNSGWYFGVAIVDTYTGEIDFGEGFK